MAVPDACVDDDPRMERSGESPLSHWMRFSFGPPETDVRLGLERLGAMVARG